MHNLEERRDVRGLEIVMPSSIRKETKIRTMFTVLSVWQWQSIWTLLCTIFQNAQALRNLFHSQFTQCLARFSCCFVTPNYSLSKYVEILFRLNKWNFDWYIKIVSNQPQLVPSSWNFRLCRKVFLCNHSKEKHIKMNPFST